MEKRPKTSGPLKTSQLPAFMTEVACLDDLKVIDATWLVSLGEFEE